MPVGKSSSDHSESKRLAVARPDSPPPEDAGWKRSSAEQPEIRIQSADPPSRSKTSQPPKQERATDSGKPEHRDRVAEQDREGNKTPLQPPADAGSRSSGKVESDIDELSNLLPQMLNLHKILRRKHRHQEKERARVRSPTERATAPMEKSRKSSHTLKSGTSAKSKTPPESRHEASDRRKERKGYRKDRNRWRRHRDVRR